MDTVLTEDSNSGFQFFSSLFENVVSAGGNSRVLCYIQKIKSGDILVIADGAAFGAIIENCLEYAAVCSGQRIAVWMPESFEYLILRLGLIRSKELDKILQAIPDYVESKEYESWEQYFTQLLVLLTHDKTYRYSKKILDGYYMQKRSIQKIIENFPDEIKHHLEDKFHYDLL